MRSWDAKILDEAVMYFTKGSQKDFDAIEWIADQSNVLLKNEDDYAIFEHGKNPLRLVGHYYFKSRGKKAVETARSFLREIFATGIKTVSGLTPLSNLGARWMSRHLGFTSHGVVHAINGPHELFIMQSEDIK